MSTPSPAELLIIIVVLLVVVGPEQLPSVIRKAGKFVSQARTMTDGLRGEFMAGLDEIDRSADPRRWATDGADKTDEAGRADPLPVTHSASPALRNGSSKDITLEDEAAQPFDGAKHIDDETPDAVEQASELSADGDEPQDWESNS